MMNFVLKDPVDFMAKLENFCFPGQATFPKASAFEWLIIWGVLVINT